MALIKTTDELKLYIEIDVNMDIELMQPSLDSAEIDFIVPLLGKEYYEEFKTAYDAGPLEDLFLAIKPYIQKALANYAAFLSVERIGVVVGSLGIQQHFNQNSQPAPAWKVKELKISYLTAADKAADLLLEFLEFASVLQAGVDEADRPYKKWYDSDANTSISGCIVYKTSIANKHIDILGSRRLFLRLKKRIQEIEAAYVKRLICKDQYGELITQLKARTVSTENKELLARLEPIISKRALYAMLPMLPVIITADGLFLQSSNDSVIQKMQAGQTEKAALMLQLKEGEDTGYEANESDLQTYLNDHIESYQLIKNSPCWSGTSASVDQKWKVDNDPCNKHFSV